MPAKFCLRCKQESVVFFGFSSPCTTYDGVHRDLVPMPSTLEEEADKVLAAMKHTSRKSIEAFWRSRNPVVRAVQHEIKIRREKWLL